MKKLFIFSSDSLMTGSTQFFRVVIAEDREQAEHLILGSSQDAFRAHLVAQMKKGGVYHRCSSIQEALREYFPYVVEKPFKEGVIIGAANGQAQTY